MTKYLYFNNYKIEYDQKGRGKDLLFVCGAELDYNYHIDFIEELSKFFRVTVFNFPSYNQVNSSLDLSVDSYQDVIKIMINDLKLYKPTIVGYSLGGGIALLFSKICPNYVCRAVAICPLIIPIEISLIKNIILMIENFLAKLKVMSLSTVLKRELRARIHHRLSWKVRKLLVSFNISDIINDIITPTIVILGEKDNVNQSTQIIKLFNGKNIYLKIIPDKGHYLFYEKDLSSQIIDIIRD